MPHPIWSRLASAACLAAVAILAAHPLGAQSNGNGDGGGLRTLAPEDYGRWERLGATELSPKGDWVAVSISRVDGEDELRIQPVSDPDSTIRVPHGSQAAFNEDGTWVGFRIGVSEEERERLEERERPVRTKLGLVSLATGEMTTIDDVASFAFSGDGRFISMRRYPPPGRRDADGVDVIVRELATASQTTFGNVSDVAWRDAGALLAFVIDAEGMAGNGVAIYDAASGVLTTLDSKATRYSGLQWREQSFDLAVLRRVDPDGEDAWSDTTHVALAWTGLDRAARQATPKMLSESTPGFPAGHRVPDFGRFRWDDEGGRIYFGLDPREPACERPGRAGGEDAEPEERPDSAGREPADEEQEDTDPCEGPDDDDRPSVEIWHAADVDIVPTQKVRQNQSRREHLLAVWRLDDNRVVQLEDEVVEQVRTVDGADLALGLDETPYDDDRMFGPQYYDVYRVDVRTGERAKLLDRMESFFQLNAPSSTGRYALYVQDDHVWSLDLRSGARVNLTEDLPSSFVDLEDDHVVPQKPPYGSGGWLEGDRAVLLYDEHDVWRVSPDGSGGERLTDGVAANLRHRIVRLDPDEDVLDPDEPVYMSIYDDWAETWGYARADRLGATPRRLLLEPARVAGLEKSEDAEVYAYRTESYERSPSLLVGGPGLADATTVVETNPFQHEYAWGRAELVEFENTWGDRLQGSLYYPADYQPGRRYPMIVYIYEIRSNAVRAYQVPAEDSYYNMQVWSQNGYFVFQPDIVYRDRDPGVSAVASIVPAVEAVVETGMVDPDRIGLIGHSWGGYQTTFAVTQTNIFAAAVAGAPLTNLFSMYLSVYWNSGGTDARIFEVSQGRMEVPFWEDEDAYRRNSPVFHIENMTTPLLMAQGTEDGAVDFNQGVEFYNAARRANKPFVFLVYNGENHGFANEANQLDYHRRINEWFGHYLKGEDAPPWIMEGVPYLEQLESARTSLGRSGPGRD